MALSRQLLGAKTDLKAQKNIYQYITRNYPNNLIIFHNLIGLANIPLDQNNTQLVYLIKKFLNMEKSDLAIVKICK